MTYVVRVEIVEPDTNKLLKKSGFYYLTDRARWTRKGDENFYSKIQALTIVVDDLVKKQIDE